MRERFKYDGIFRKVAHKEVSSSITLIVLSGIIIYILIINKLNV